MVNKFLFAAYALVWILFMAYAWSLSRRQGRLSKEIDDLKARRGCVTGRDERPETRD